MARKPAATLTHLGPGLEMGWLTCIMQKRLEPLWLTSLDHATYHRKYDAPLTSDVEGVARPMSNWIRFHKLLIPLGTMGPKRSKQLCRLQDK